MWATIQSLTCLSLEDCQLQIPRLHKKMYVDFETLEVSDTLLTAINLYNSYILSYGN